jgi:RNA polymerase sigma factor (sigma-70 family)
MGIKIEEHYNLVWEAVKKVTRDDELSQDLFQEGVLFLLERSGNYDSSRANFYTYIFAPLLRHLRKRSAELTRVVNWSEEETQVHEHKEDIMDFREEFVEYERLLEKAEKLLDERDFAIFFMAYGEGKSNQQIAKEVGLSKERVRQILNESLEAVK